MSTINQLSKTFGKNEIMSSSFFHYCYGINECQRPLGLELDKMSFWENKATNNLSGHFAKEQRRESGVPVLEPDGSWTGKESTSYYYEWAVTKTLYRAIMDEYGLEAKV